MIFLQWSIDGLLALTLLWLAWRLLTNPDLFRAIVLFIAFGLIMALVWVRLAAFDIALAEAIIGAGISGTALLATLRRVGEHLPRQRRPGASRLGS
jgi:energy-converting hydrogenase B subunit D